MRTAFVVCFGAIVLLAGCASGSVGLPIYALPAHLYSPAEKLGPGPGRDADGEVRFCSSLDVMGGMAKAQELRKSALANIGKVCGGDENYFIVSEGPNGDRTEYLAAGGMMKATCGVTTGHSIYFKCNRANSQVTRPKK